MKSTAHFRPPGPRRFLLVVAIFTVAAGQAWAEKAALLQPIPEVKLKDGTVLHGVTFVSVGGASITGKWDGGRGSIPLSQLPDGLRADLVPIAPAKPLAAPTAPKPATSAEPTPAANPYQLPTDLKLTNGFIMHEAKVVSWQADAMLVSYVGGKVLVKMDSISPEQRKTFEAHKVLVYARQARIEAARAANRAGKTPNMAGPAEDPSPEEQSALIELGISSHQLVAGMTKKEVYEAFGAPARTGTDAAAPDFLYWFYPGRGRDANGAPCDRIVGFNKGVLDGWKDH